jgi:ATP-dependent Zn protease
MLFQSVWTTWRTVESIPYSQFLTLLKEGKIVDATVLQEQITGRLKEPINGRELFVTNRVEPALAEQLGKSGASFTGTVQNTFLSTMLSWVMPIVVFGGIWFFVFRRFAEKQGMGGLINIGKSKDYSEDTAREIDLAVKKLIDEAYGRTKTLLTERRSVLDEGAKLLLEKETLTPEDFPALAPSRELSVPPKEHADHK